MRCSILPNAASDNWWPRRRLHSEAPSRARGKAVFEKLVIASNNPGKLREIGHILAPLGIEALPQSAFGVPEADEPHGTFIENALVKARHAACITGLPALADDSGICVDALGGAPGVHSARYAGKPRSDERNNAKLLEMLGDRQDRQAHYYCVILGMRHAPDPQPLIAVGLWPGGKSCGARAGR